jgi:hypothetical protein
MENTNEGSSSEPIDMNKIDANIRDAQGASAGPGSKRGRKPRLTDEQKEQARLEREERKEERARLKAERDANRKPAHLAKVEKALSKLPDLSETAQATFLVLTDGNLSLPELDALAAHVEGYVRMERTKQALQRTMSVGQTVKIVGGDPKYVGQTGTVEKVQRIRCYVQVPGQEKSVYLYTSDVETISAEEAQEVEEVEVQEVVEEQEVSNA